MQHVSVACTGRVTAHTSEVVHNLWRRFQSDASQLKADLEQCGSDLCRTRYSVKRSGKDGYPVAVGIHPRSEKICRQTSLQ